MTRSVKFKTETVSDNQIILYIRQTPELDRIWDSMNSSQRRKALADAGGDVWHLDAVLNDAKEVSH